MTENKKEFLETVIAGGPGRYEGELTHIDSREDAVMLYGKRSMSFYAGEKYILDVIETYRVRLEGHDLFKKVAQAMWGFDEVAKIDLFDVENDEEQRDYATLDEFKRAGGHRYIGAGIEEAARALVFQYLETLDMEGQFADAVDMFERCNRWNNIGLSSKSSNQYIVTRFFNARPLTAHERVALHELKQTGELEADVQSLLEEILT